MNISLLENARAAMADVKTLEIMLRDVNYLRGSSTVHRARSNNGSYGDPTFETVQRLDKLSQKLIAAKEEASHAYEVAADELERIRSHDSEMHTIFFLRYMKHYTWQKIADHFGVSYTGDAVKQRHNRYLRKHSA